jgi:glycosyltransferase involved in cell wall biosynthesis
MNNKKNIMLVISTLTGGGAELVVSNLCQYLNRDLFNVSVCYLQYCGERGDKLKSFGYDVFGLPKSKFFRNNYFSFLKLNRIIRKKKIDLVHSHSIDALIDSGLCKMINWRVKLIHSFHYGNYPNYKKKYIILEKIFSRVANKLVAVGKEQKKSIQSLYSVPDKNIITIWNGVEKTKKKKNIEIIDKFLKNNKIIIGSISTLIEQKGITYILEAANEIKSRYSNSVFLIIGDGPLKEKLKAKCEKLGLDDYVFFSGWIDDAVSKCLPYFDIFIQSSLWEAMSMVILEAMAAEKPIIASDVGDNKYMIRNGHSGLLTNPKDVETMTDALDKLIKNKNLRQEMAKNALNKYHQIGTVQIMIHHHEKLYSELLLKK